MHVAIVLRDPDFFIQWKHNSSDEFSGNVVDAGSPNRSLTLQRECNRSLTLQRYTICGGKIFLQAFSIELDKWNPGGVDNRTGASKQYRGWIKARKAGLDNASITVIAHPIWHEQPLGCTYKIIVPFRLARVASRPTRP